MERKRNPGHFRHWRRNPDCASLHPGYALIFHLQKEPAMTGIVILQPIVALVAGILILIVPRILNYVVALYLILAGLLGLAPHFMR
jgi:hypothetical protein